MPVATVTFTRCVLNAPECAAGEGLIGSRLYFDLDLEGAGRPGLFVDLIHQAEWEGADPPIEVRGPEEGARLVAAPVFRSCLLFYYRQAAAAWGSGLSFLRGCTVTAEMRVQLEL